MRSVTPLQRIRKTCLWCMGGQRSMVQDCPSKSCPFYPYRFGRIEPGASRRLLRAIRRFCLACAGSAQDVKTCTAGQGDSDPCWLLAYRFGKRPKTGRKTNASSPTRSDVQGKAGKSNPGPKLGCQKGFAA
jgi:hypothetical protein